MSLEDIFAQCEGQGIELAVEDDNLKLSFDTPPSEQLTQLLRDNKPALIAFISQFNQLQNSTDEQNNIKPLAHSQKTQSTQLSYSQLRLWLIDQIEQGSLQYNMPSRMKFKGNFNENIAEQAFREIIRRHESLRTVFIKIDQQVKQQTQTKFEFNCTQLDLSTLSKKQQQIAIDKIVREDMNRVFDLSKDLMLRVTIIRTDVDCGQLLFNMHHIASDGWSIDILNREFSQLYTAFSQAKKSPLSALEIQYSDYADWQRQPLQQQQIAKNLTYWKNQLDGIPQTHSLPLDNARVSQQTFNGAVHCQQLNPQLIDSIDLICQQHSVTLFMFLQTAFSILLARYSNETDIVMGTPISGRLNTQIEPLIGFFVNTLVLRSDLQGNPAFIDFLQTNKQTILNAFNHQQVPFENLVEELNPQRSLAHNALFQIMFVMQNNQHSDLELPDVTLTTDTQLETFIRFDLELKIYQGEQGLDLKWLYNTSLFQSTSIERLANNFEILLKEIISDPYQKIQSLPLVEQQETQLLIDWNKTDVDYPRELTIHELFISQLIKKPDAVAIIDEQGEMTYSQLFAVAFTLSQQLRDLSVNPQELVAIRLAKGRAQVIATLAIMMSGAAYLPLESYWPDERCKGIIEASNCRYLVLDDKDDKIENCALNLLFIQNTTQGSIDPVKQAKQFLNNPDRKTAVEQLAYVIFTSGSTGSPKGVAIEHRSAVNTLLDINTQYKVSSNDRILAVSALSFDLSVYDFFGILAIGASIVFPDKDKANEPLHWLDLLQQHAISIWNTTPASAVLLVEQMHLNNRSKSANVKHFLLSGDWIPPNLPKRLWQAFSGCKVYSLGGATEGSIWSIHYPIKQDLSHRKSIPYGRPLSNQSFYILDQQNALCPIGVIGELHIGGIGVAREYYADQQRTKASFIWHQELAKRLYKTGDLGRFIVDPMGRPDVIEFIGRVDHQVKVRGYRIELGEIESTINGYPSIETSIVLAQGDSSENKQLIAYICPTSEFLDSQTLKASEKLIAGWTNIFDQTYHQNTQVSTTDLSGWQSSYTGQAIPADEMLEWVDGTVQRILALSNNITNTSSNNTKKLLEIGCGTGLLLYRYAEHFAEIQAIDISSAALQGIQQYCLDKDWKHVHLHQGDALSIKQFSQTKFDTIVINSVVQYFPNRKYLMDVITAAVSLLADQGQLFIGDIRNLDLLDAHVTAIERDKTTEPCSVQSIASRVQHSIQQEQELLISPTLFALLDSQLKDIEDVSIVLKRGKYNNEMTRYRYDVILTKGKKNTLNTTPIWLQWDSPECQHHSALKTLLTHQRYRNFAVSGVKNERIQQDLWLSNGIKSWKGSNPLTAQHLDNSSNTRAGERLEELLNYAESLGYQSYATWSQTDLDKVDLFFSLDQFPSITARQSYRQNVLTNYPQLTQLTTSLTNQLKSHLKQTLPNYMLPSCYLYLEKLPLTQNGKIDRNALPIPGKTQFLTGQQVAPGTPTEVALSLLWQEILCLETVGIHDNFFELGGHSLLATRLINGITNVLKVELPLKFLFSLPTIAELAEFLDEEASQLNIKTPIITPAKIKQKNILSYAQQRLWLINRMEGPSARYNICSAFKLKGKLNLGAFKQTIQKIIQRHHVLRSHFIEQDGIPWQVVQQNFELPLTEIDLGDIQLIEQRDSINKLIRQQAATPFYLTNELLIRFVLIQQTKTEHSIIITMHHIASDGWSLEVLVREFSLFYNFYCEPTGLSEPLPPLKLQYLDYAYWQRDWMKGDLLTQQINYWRNYLQDIPELHSLNIDKERPEQHGFSGGRWQHTINHNLTAELQTFSKKHGVTLFMTLQTAFSVLLSRYSNETDIIMGTPIAGRYNQDIEPLIGFFVNTLVLRTQCEGKQNFLSLLIENKKNILDAYQYQHLPFELLVEELQPQRNLSSSPLFQIMFILQNIEQAELNLSGLELVPIEQKNNSIKFDLELNIIESEQQLNLHWSYNHDLFVQSTIERFAESYTLLLNSIITSPETAIDQFPIVSQLERQKQLLSWNSNQQEFDQTLTIHQLFETSVDLFPDNLALVFEHQQLSYIELNKQANQLAHYLIKRGVNSNSIVALCMQKSLDLIIALLAINKAGGAYLPLDPASPNDRLKQMLLDSEAEFVLTHKHLSAKLEFMQSTPICLDTQKQSQQIADYPIYNPKNRVLSNDLAYLIYTSGSSGSPKGVLIEHKALVNSILCDIKTFAVIPESRFLHMTSFNFDAASSHLFMSLCAGASVYLFDPHNEKYYDLMSFAKHQEITHTALPVSMLAAQKPMQLDNLKTLIVGGEHCPEPLADFWSLGRRFFNVYGPTETTITATIADYSQELQRHTIGKPINNTQCYVLDRHQQPVPIGVHGELYIGGIGVARGYLNQPNLTQTHFINDPFSQQPARMYRTGDRVFWNVNGFLEIVGRLDQQVKIRGNRIELGEIESRLNQIADINHTIVLVRDLKNKDGNKDKQLVAYIVFKKPILKNTMKNLTKEQRVIRIKEKLQSSLPSYMIPGIFVVCDKIPLTINGKVDQKSLPSPTNEDIYRTCYVPPQTKLERQLCDIWQQLLNHDEIGIEDNFFELGGHSLLATRLASRIREKIKIEISIKNIFEFPTIRGLSNTITEQSNSLIIPSIEPHELSMEQIPLSFSQQRLWFIDQLEGGSAQYNITAAFRLEGKLDKQALKDALQTIITRHQVLRTNFILDNKIHNGQVFQRINQNPTFTLIEHDLYNLTGSQQQQRVMQLTNLDSNFNFKLDTDLLFKVQLARLNIHSHVLLVNMHHIVADGWSMKIVVTELSQLYDAFKNGQTNPLTEIKIQYADYANWQRNWIKDKVLQLQLDYWQNQLLDIPQVHNLPLDRPRPPHQSYRGDTCRQIIGEKLSEKINQFCLQQNITLFMLLHGALSILLARYSNQTDIVIGTPVAGRVHQNTESLIGFLVNTLVLRSQLGNNPTVNNLLQINKQMILEAYSYQHLPFEMLVEKLKPQRSLSHNPLFQVMLVLQNNEQQDLALTGMKFFPLAADHSHTQFDLNLNINESNNQLTLNWQFATDLFDITTIEQMANNFAVLIENMIITPEQRILDLSLLTNADKQKIAIWQQGDELNRAKQPNNLQQLFVEQAIKNPNAVAVEFNQQILSYEHLNHIVNYYANQLLKKGVNANTLVALYIERSLEMIVGMLAILKAGGAYMPFDTTLPQAMISKRLKIAQPKLILTSQLFNKQASEFELPILSINLANQSSEEPEVNTISDDSAYVLFTSGSTGEPKGIDMAHAPLINLITAIKHDCSLLAEKNHLLQFSSIGFDMSFVDAFLAFSTGGKLCLIDTESQLNMKKLAKTINSAQLTLLNLPYSAVQALCDYCNHKNIIFTSLKAIISTAEQLKITDEIRQFFIRHHQSNKQQLTLINHYGPAETHVVTSHILTGKPQQWPDIPNIGKPLANIQTFILDQQFNPVPVGVPGELYLAGAGLAKGYINSTKLTAERFIEHPVSQDSRLYKTGDWARWLPDGNLEYLGRIDNQVKIHGFRIELAEVEACLLTHPEIKETLVIAFNNRLVGYVVSTSETLSQNNLQLWCKQYLPDYMIPKQVFIMEYFSLNTNGKVDRKALPDPQQHLTSKFIAAETTTELLLSEIWNRLLSTKESALSIGKDDDFFALGGHSLLITQLISAIRSEWNIELQVRNIFEHQTLAQQALLIDEELILQKAMQNNNKLESSEKISQEWEF